MSKEETTTFPYKNFKKNNQNDDNATKRNTLGIYTMLW